MTQTSVSSSTKTELYPTSDSSLAAYLHSLGFLLHHANNENFPTVFYFKETPELLEKVQFFQTGEAVGKISVYQKSYKYILSLTHHNVR